MFQESLVTLDMLFTHPSVNRCHWYTHFSLRHILTSVYVSTTAVFFTEDANACLWVSRFHCIAAENPSLADHNFQRMSMVTFWLHFCNFCGDPQQYAAAVSVRYHAFSQFMGVYDQGRHNINVEVMTHVCIHIGTVSYLIISSVIQISCNTVGLFSHWCPYLQCMLNPIAFFAQYSVNRFKFNFLNSFPII